MNNKLAAVGLLFTLSLVSAFAAQPTRVGDLSVAGTNTVREVVVTNGITLGGVRNTAWPAGGIVGTVSNAVAAAGLLAVDGTKTNGIAATAAHVTNALGMNLQGQLDLKAPLASPSFSGTVTTPNLNVTAGLSTPLLQTSSLVVSNALKGNQVTLAYDSFGTNMVLDLNAGNQFWATLTTHTKFYITNWPTLGTTNHQPITLHVWENATGGYRALWSETNFVFSGYSSELNSTNASARNTLTFAVGAGLTNLIYVGTPTPQIPWITGGTNVAGTVNRVVLGIVGSSQVSGVQNFNITNRFYAIPFTSKAGGVITNIAINVTIGGGAGSVIRIGIYDNNSDAKPYPGNLLGETGDVASTGTGMTGGTVNIRLLPNRIYWATVVAFIGTHPTGANTLPQHENLLGYNALNPIDHMYVSQAYGALPATYPSGSTFISNGSLGYAFFAQFQSSP